MHGDCVAPEVKPQVPAERADAIRCAPDHIEIRRAMSYAETHAAKAEGVQPLELAVADAVVDAADDAGCGCGRPSLRDSRSPGGSPRHRPARARSRSARSRACARPRTGRRTWRPRAARTRRLRAPDISPDRRRCAPGSRSSCAAAAAPARAPPAPIAERRAPDQRKSSSETFFHSGMPSSVCSGVKNWTRKLPSFGFSVGTSAATPGCAGM